MKKGKKIIVNLLVAVMIISCMSITVYAEGETGFTLSQSTLKAFPGQGLEITLTGQNLKDLYAYEAVITFDPAFAEFDKAESKLEGFFITPKEDDGKITIAFTKVGKKAGEQGSIPLCTIAFKGKAEGNTNVKLVSVKALDSNLTAVIYNNGTRLVKTFKDLAGFEWAKMQIEFLASLGIIAGTSETTFNPGSNITRADFIILLVKALNLSADVDGNFNDVAKSDYFYKWVGIAKKLGIVAGAGGNQFKPREYISRQDMMVIVSKALKIAGKKMDESAIDLSMFSDSGEVAPYAVKAVAQLAKEGIIVGSNGRLAPKGETSRAATAVILYKILNREFTVAGAK